MKLSRIHVNQHIIKRNQKTQASEPPISIKTGGKTLRGDRVEVHGPCTVVYRPDKPLSCGAHVWIETRAAVEVFTQGVDDAGVL